MSREREFICRDYRKKPEFASFLPGIAGITGIPLWCYYVNRGQGVVSFGSDNKDNPIMEFYPAHVAYQKASVTGFRTFYRVDGKYMEPFSDPDVPHEMRIRMNSFDVVERDGESGLETKATYFILPGEAYGALVRRLAVTNRSGRDVDLEIVDGMPALIPYGVSNESLKEMAQLSKAWMQVEDAGTGIPYYRVRASMEDTASVEEVEGGNFCLGLDGTGKQLPVLVDARALFGYDSALTRARIFEDRGLDGIWAEKQAYSNQMPCAFFSDRKQVKAGETLLFYELYGHAGSKAELGRITRSFPTPASLEEKFREAEEITDRLVSVIDTRTGHPDFDAYSRYTYMDNVLRGGYPVEAGGKVIYVYSRKHGDLEREYNYFSMSPEPYSQGNGNFRDVNQNRRCDPFFTPQAGRRNIDLFYSLIQPDGYNPLSVEKTSFVTDDEAVRSELPSPFTPGDLYRYVEETVKEDNDGTGNPTDHDGSSVGTESAAGDAGLRETSAAARQKRFEDILSAAVPQPAASFKEGYWSDHWTYNLDLVEEYLGIWPDREEELLTGKTFTWYQPEARVNPRAKRYVKTEKGIRQYRAVTEIEGALPGQTVRSDYGKGEPVKSSLFEKLIALCALKTATLDPLGMGVEMEGGKPGWYDALNGLPGLLGSSMTETCELARTLHFTTDALRRYPGTLDVSEELGSLVTEMADILSDFAENQSRAGGQMQSASGNRASGQTQTASGENLARWDRLNDAKEAYREKIYRGFSCVTVCFDRADLARILDLFTVFAEDGIRRSIAESGSGIIPAYFYYEVTDYSEDADGIHLKAVKQKKVPDYLEGPVRCLKLPLSREQKENIYEKVKESGLYDRKLSMYKVNASLADASYEIGRVKCFTPGWLENESIWLHMEYKYLLELLRSGLYPEFAGDFRLAGIPFLEEETYGRSILENSSFLVSSANPDESLHGRGFVARLSGSTAEFLSIWQIMMFGERPFGMEKESGVLTAELKPVIPAYLLGEDLAVSARFMGRTRVTYHFAEKRDYFPGTYRIEKMVLTGEGASRAAGGPAPEEEVFEGAALRGAAAEALRSGAYGSVEIYVR